MEISYIMDHLIVGAQYKLKKCNLSDKMFSAQNTNLMCSKNNTSSQDPSSLDTIIPL